MLSGNVLTSGAIVNDYSSYDIRTGNFNEWLVGKPKMGIVKITFGSGATYTSAGMTVSGQLERALNLTTLQHVSVLDVTSVIAPYIVRYDMADNKIHMYGMLSGTASTTTAHVEVASGQVTLDSAAVYLQVFGT